MGLDWRALDLSSYFEAFTAHQDGQEGGEKPEADPDALAKVMAARGDGGNPKAGQPIAGSRGAPRGD